MSYERSAFCPGLGVTSYYSTTQPAVIVKSVGDCIAYVIDVPYKIVLKPVSVDGLTNKRISRSQNKTTFISGADLSILKSLLSKEATLDLPQSMNCLMVLDCPHQKSRHMLSKGTGFEAEGNVSGGSYTEVYEGAPPRLQKSKL